METKRVTRGGKKHLLWYWLTDRLSLSSIFSLVLFNSIGIPNERMDILKRKNYCFQTLEAFDSIVISNCYSNQRV